MVKIVGLKELNRKLDAIAPSMQRAVRESMEQGAQEVVNLARSLVPERTGRLKDSIGWTWGDPPKGSLTLARSSRVRITGGTTSRITIYAGNETAFYVRWVEFGTAAQAANPFFFPAWRTLKRRIVARNNRNVNKALRGVSRLG